MRALVIDDDPVADPGEVLVEVRTAAVNRRDLLVRDPPGPAYWRSILGTTLGSPRDFAALLDAVEEGGWRPVIDSVHPLAQADEAHERLRRGEHTGKLVLAPHG